MNPNITARRDESPDYWDEGRPDALDDAVKCECGGTAIWHTAKNAGDTHHIHCSNYRCGRIVVAEGRTPEESVQLWNNDIAIDACEKHSFMLVPSDGPACQRLWRCVFCPETRTDKEL